MKQIVKADGADRLRIFVPLQKVDEDQRLVYGLAAEEQVDKADEIFDYETSKPLFEAWSGEMEKASAGKSKGNVRAMHTNIAAGVLKDIAFNDEARNIPVVAHVVDDAEWKKVLAGVYTGFSIGGSYVKRWNDPDDPTKKRYTAEPAEISLVDNPCMYGAHFEVVKAAAAGKDLRTGKAIPGEEVRQVQFGEHLRKLDAEKALDAIETVLADPEVRKDAAAAQAATESAIEWLKTATAEAALLPGDPDTWTLDDLICAMNRALYAKNALEYRAEQDATAASEPGAAGDSEPTPEPTEDDMTPDATKTAAPKKDAAPDSTKQLVQEVLKQVLAELKKDLAKHEEPKEPDTKGEPAPVTKGADSSEGDVGELKALVKKLEARLQKVEATPAAAGRPVKTVEKSLGSLQAGGQDISIEDLAEAVAKAEASGQLTGQAREDVRKALAMAAIPRG